VSRSRCIAITPGKNAAGAALAHVAVE